MEPLSTDQIVLLAVAFLGVVALGIYLGYRHLSKKQEIERSRPLEDLSSRIMFESRDAAAKVFSSQVLEDIYQNNYFPVRVKCGNCHLSGPLLVPRGQKTTEEFCPKCYVPMLVVVDTSTNGDKPLYYPPLPQDIDGDVQKEVDRMVEEAWDLGQIRRREGMFTS